MHLRKKLEIKKFASWQLHPLGRCDPQLIFMKYSNLGDFDNVVDKASFCCDLMQGFCSMRVENVFSYA
jgi:hypothetical protein